MSSTSSAFQYRESHWSDTSFEQPLGAVQAYSSNSNDSSSSSNVDHVLRGRKLEGTAIFRWCMHEEFCIRHHTAANIAGMQSSAVEPPPTLLDPVDLLKSSEFMLNLCYRKSPICESGSPDELDIRVRVYCNSVFCRNPETENIA